MSTQPAAPEAPRFTELQLQEYLDALHQSVALLNAGRPHATAYTFEPVWGKKYIKIVMRDGGRSGSVHAFVEIATGALVKSAGWAAPQRNSDGSLAVRFQLADDTERARLCAALRENSHAFTGGYLYKR